MANNEQQQLELAAPASSDAAPAVGSFVDVFTGAGDDVTYFNVASIDGDVIVSSTGKRAMLQDGRWQLLNEQAPGANGQGPAEYYEGRRIVKVYSYTDENGRLLYQKLRTDPKGFYQRRPSGEGWINGLGDVRRVLYNLPAVIAASTVFVVEGEEDADRLNAAGVVATTAGGAGHWSQDYTDTLAGKTVPVIPDNDKAGIDGAHKIAGLLTGAAAQVKYVELPGVGQGGDVSDWLDAGNTIEQLHELCKAAPVYNGPGAIDHPERTKQSKQQENATAGEIHRANGRSVIIPQTSPEYAKAALDRAAQIIRTATEGSRNNTLRDQAPGIYELVNGGELDRAEVEQALTAAALAAGLEEKEIRATLKSAADYVGDKARTAPEPGAANSPKVYRLEDPDTGEFLDRWGLMGPAQIMAPVPPTTYVIERMIPLSSLSALAAQSGSLKTFVLMDACVCVAGGKPWLPGANGIIDGQGMGLQVGQAPTLWVDLDNGRLRTRRRLQALIRGHELPADTPAYLISMPSDPLLVGTDPASVDLLRQYVEHTGARLVVIDNLATISGDIEENSAAMARVLFPFRNLVDDLGIALIFIHHTSKDGAHYRGSTAIRGAVDLLLHGVREKGSDIITVKTDKARDVRAPRITAQFHFEHEDNGYDLRSAYFTGTTDTTDHIRAAMMDVIREAGEMGLYTLADETYKKVKGIASRAAVREAVKANVEGLPGVALSEERAGKITVKYEAVKL